MDYKRTTNGAHVDYKRISNGVHVDYKGLVTEFMWITNHSDKYHCTGRVETYFSLSLKMKSCHFGLIKH